VKRRIINVLTVISLILCLATLALWTTRERHIAWLRYRSQSETDFHPLQLRLISDPEGVAFERSAWKWSNMPSNAYWRGAFDTGFDLPASRLLRRVVGWNRKAFGIAYFRSTRPSDSLEYPGLTHHAMGLRLPHEVFAVLFAVCPVWWSAKVCLNRFRRWIGGMRLTKGHCPTCGYDLRATPERCPECGTVVEAASNWN
jgi:hypothetical protein